MKATKYYFKNSDSEVCYDKSYFDDMMTDDKVTEMEVYEAIPDKIPGIFWCKVDCFCGDDSKDSCGLQCKQYKPRNGKSGCCRHYTTKLYAHGDKILIKL